MKTLCATFVAKTENTVCKTGLGDGPIIFRLGSEAVIKNVEKFNGMEALHTVCSASALEGICRQT